MSTHSLDLAHYPEPGRLLECFVRVSVRVCFPFAAQAKLTYWSLFDLIYVELLGFFVCLLFFLFWFCLPV